MPTKLVCSSVSLTLGAGCLITARVARTVANFWFSTTKTENRPYVPAGSFAFAFEQIHYGISQADIIAAAVERYERPPPPVRPPGFSWAAIRREWEAQRPR